MSELDRSHTQRSHVLVVEDDYATGEMLLLLQMEGYRASWAGTSGEALTQLTAGDRPSVDIPPDIVLLDLQLPTMNGVELMWQVKQLNRTPPPVIVISAWRESSAIAAAEQIGAHYVLIKPFSVDELLERIAAVEDWLALRAAARE